MAVKALVAEEVGGATAVVDALNADQAFDVVSSRGLDNIVDAVRRCMPDVLVLLPAGEPQALKAIAEVMGRQPVPILVLGDGSISRDKAVGAGAVEVMSTTLLEPGGQSELRARVHAISLVDVIRHVRGRERQRDDVPLPVVGLAASTGGPPALASVLKGLGGLAAAVLVVQHIHPGFMQGFSEWMGRECPLPVELAAHQATLEAGRVYVAPANVHLKLGPGRTTILDPNPVTLHRPSADILFESIALHAGRQAIGVLLTGMGDDGAAGLLAIRQAGGRTIAQDEASSAVYGMPQVADQLGAAERILPLDCVAAAILGAALLVG